MTTPAAVTATTAAAAAATTAETASNNFISSVNLPKQTYHTPALIFHHPQLLRTDHQGGSVSRTLQKSESVTYIAYTVFFNIAAVGYSTDATAAYNNITAALQTYVYGGQLNTVLQEYATEESLPDLETVASNTFYATGECCDLKRCLMCAILCIYFKYCTGDVSCSVKM